MKRVRITYPGAFHHTMNRGINGEDIFIGPKNKLQFLEYLQACSKSLKIKIFAYCILDNHYHLILENSSGRISDFFRELNGIYGMYYRKINGGSGYVFQNRYKSTLIQDDSYLQIAIAYVLLNPVRAGIVKNYTDYYWSSANEYFVNKSSELVDNDFVEDLFQSGSSFIEFVYSRLSLDFTDLPLVHTKYGEILGRADFLETAMSNFNRRKEGDSLGVKRTEDLFYEPVEKVIWEFEKKIGMRIADIDINSHKGKRMRGELLVRLKEGAGLKYAEIVEIPPFTELRLSSLGKLYQDSRNRLRKTNEKVKK